MKEGRFFENHTTKADRTNELPNKERKVELKLPYNSKLDNLAKVVFDYFANAQESDFKIAETLPYIAESLTTQFRYSAKNSSGDKRKLFSIVVRQKDGLITIKIKGEKSKNEGTTTRDETEYELPYKEWTEKVEKEIKIEQANNFQILPKEIKKLKEIKKRKLKIRLENKKTHRVYTVGIVDKTNEKKTNKKNLAIEYVGKEFSTTDSENKNDESEKEIIYDLNFIHNQVLTLRNDGTEQNYQNKKPF